MFRTSFQLRYINAYIALFRNEYDVTLATVALLIRSVGWPPTAAGANIPSHTGTSVWSPCMGIEKHWTWIFFMHLSSMQRNMTCHMKVNDIQVHRNKSTMTMPWTRELKRPNLCYDEHFHHSELCNAFQVIM